MPAPRTIAKQIDAIIAEPGDWRSDTLARLRELITATDPALEEDVKWKKPSNPSGVPVWSHDGIVCIGETLKRAVRLTFPKGAALGDPKQLFNRRLDSASVRAVDFEEHDKIDVRALKALVREAIRLNTAKPRK